MNPFTNFNKTDVSNFSTANASNVPRPFGTPGPFGNPPMQNYNVFGSNAKNIAPFASPTANATFGNAFSSIGNLNNKTNNPFQNCPSYNNNQNTFGYSSFGNSFNKPGPFSLEPEKSIMKCEPSKFTPKIITETVMRDNRPVHLQLRLQNIHGMSGYEHQSFEEVRQADYLANRKEPQLNSSILKNNTFTTPTNAFSSNCNKLSFANTTPTFGNVSEPKSNMFFGNNSQPNNSPTLKSRDGDNIFFNKPFPSQNTTFGNNLSTSTSLGFPLNNSMNNFGMKPPIENSTVQQEFPKMFGNQAEKTVTFPQQPVQNQLFFNTHTNPTPFNAKQPTLQGLSGNTLNNTSPSSFPILNKSTPLGPTNQIPAHLSSNTFIQPPINAIPIPSMNNYKPNLPSFNVIENKPIIQNSTFPSINFPNNTLTNSNFNNLQSISTPTLTNLANHDNIHERMISLSQQYPTPPLLKGLTPLYEEINIPLNITSNPEIIEQILQEQLSSSQERVVTASLRTRLKPFEAPLFDGLDFDGDGGNMELNRKKCPRRLFIAQYVPRENNNYEQLCEEKTEDLNKDDSKEKSEQMKSSKPEATQTDEIIEKKSPSKTKSERCGFVKTLFQLKQIQKKDSVENFPVLTDSDFQLSQELHENAKTNNHPTKITNTRKDYYTIPNLEELIKFIDSETGKCMVKGFTIGRHGYGSIYFFEEFDVSGINIDELVVFEHKEVTVYPNGNEPPVGNGLNRRCKITLERVWPTNKDTKEQIVDVKQIEESNFVEVLKKVNLSYKTEFVDYKPETGVWIFISQNFSGN